MLSYQHSYHAGGMADLHKHAVLCRVLDVLCRKERPLSYMETHAGRGLYNLEGIEAAKTGEAAQGWLRLVRDTNGNGFVEFPESFVGAVRAINGGKLLPFYPGSPALAAQILRPQDHLYLMELHPQEHDALKRLFIEDRRVQVHKRDGYEGVLALSPPEARRGLVLVDPSFEIKTEYDDAVNFLVKLRQRWPEASLLLWVPMLPAGLHERLMEQVGEQLPGAEYSQTQWCEPTSSRGMYGSLMIGVNLPYGLESGFNPVL